MLRVQDAGLAGMDDHRILAWAAQNDRILLTHDCATVPAYASERVTAGQAIAGLFVLSYLFPVGQAIREIPLIVACSEQKERHGRVVYVPL